MHKKFYFVVIRFVIVACMFSGMLMTGCEKEADWELNGTELNTIVVDGMITNEFQIQQIQLSRPVMDMNELPEPFTGATVNVSWGQQTVYFSESVTQPGVYYSNQPLAAAVNTDYILHIQKDDLVFDAQTHMVPVSPFITPTFQFKASLNKYTINWNNSQYSPFEQAVYEAIIDWSHIPGYEHPDSLSMARMLYYTLNTIDVSFLIFPQDMEEVFFPAGSNVIFSKYSLNDDFGAYLRALLSETQWQGSFFEAARSNLSGNISNGGLGYFSACAVIRTTLVVE